MQSTKHFAENLNESFAWLAFAQIEHVEPKGAEICEAALNHHKGIMGKTPPSNVTVEYVEVDQPKVPPLA